MIHRLLSRPTPQLRQSRWELRTHDAGEQQISQTAENGRASGRGLELVGRAEDHGFFRDRYSVMPAKSPA